MTGQISEPGDAETSPALPESSVEGPEMPESTPQYEWCVMRRNEDQHPWRDPTTDEQAARYWVAEAERDGFLHGAFYVARRTVGPWVRDEGDA